VKRAIAVLLCAMGAAGQAPVRVEFACSPEDLDSFGISCSAEDPCPIFLELSSVDAVGARLFLSGNLHTASTTLYAVLLSSEDGGKTWTEPIKRMRSAAYEQIQFVDFANGWISGQVIEPLPRDPFLLLTTDGGKTWRHRPLFEESRVGSIAQFWFDSRNNGELVFDRSQGGTTRHELYESMTGGESWSVKEVTTTAIHLKKARSKDDANMRVHADAGSKTYRIERRGGDKWEVLASFVIRVADCK
jgi:photosystem II stability/assembly factor-like uncharacterized protein